SSSYPKLFRLSGDFRVPGRAAGWEATVVRGRRAGEAALGAGGGIGEATARLIAAFRLRPGSRRRPLECDDRGALERAKQVSHVSFSPGPGGRKTSFLIRFSASVRIRPRLPTASSLSASAC